MSEDRTIIEGITTRVGAAFSTIVNEPLTVLAAAQAALDGYDGEPTWRGIGGALAVAAARWIVQPFYGRKAREADDAERQEIIDQVRAELE